MRTECLQASGRKVEGADQCEDSQGRHVCVGGIGRETVLVIQLLTQASKHSSVTESSKAQNRPFC